MTIRLFLEDGWKFLELYVPDKGMLALQLVECSGAVEMSQTTDYSRLFTKEFDMVFSTPSTQGAVNILKVKKGMIYLGIRALQTSHFSFKAQLYDDYTDVPQSRLIIGGSPEVSWSYNVETDTFSFKFSTIKCTICTQKEMKTAYVKILQYSPL
jgi:hypothetical protein